jgi:hypothetical protein
MAASRTRRKTPDFKPEQRDVRIKSSESSPLWHGKKLAPSATTVCGYAMIYLKLKKMGSKYSKPQIFISLIIVQSRTKTKLYPGYCSPYAFFK